MGFCAVARTGRLGSVGGTSTPSTSPTSRRRRIRSGTLRADGLAHARHPGTPGVGGAIGHRRARLRGFGGRLGTPPVERDPTRTFSLSSLTHLLLAWTLIYAVRQRYLTSLPLQRRAIFERTSSTCLPPAL